MNTITNTLSRSSRTSGFSTTLFALLFGVLATFVMSVAAPSIARADAPGDFYYGDYCSGCSDYYWEPEYTSGTYNTYDYYDTYYGSGDFYYGDYCSGCNDYYWEPEYGYDRYNTYDYYDYGNYGYSYQPEPYYYQQPYYDYSYDYYYEYEYVYEAPKPKPTAKQPVCDIEASRTRIERGQSTTLTWDSQYASSASLSSFGSVSTSGSRSVSPTSDRTYTLSVSGNGGSDTCSVTIRVEEEEEEEAPWCELRVSPTRIEDGDRATLRWETENATYASINQGIGRVDEDGGSERVSPDRDTTYRMTVRNSDGDEETCSATLRVDEENDFSSVTFTGDPVNNPPVVYLSNLPYTGLEDLSPSMWGSLAALVALLGVGGYLVFVRRQAVV